MKVSKIIKGCAYIFFIGNTIQQFYYISVNTSYLNTGKLMGAESMFSMVWACFISFLFALLIYGFAEIIEYHEKYKSIYEDDLTK